MKRTLRARGAGRALSLLAAALALTACAPEPDVVLYCAHDKVHAEPLVKRFEEQSGLRVRAEYDIEAHKTVGLVNRIREEKNRPRCDVFWNNEPAHTVAMAEEGLLASYDSPSAADIPAILRDPQHRWTGFAARARVFIVNTDLVPDPSVVHGMWDLVDPKWAGKVGMAKPLTGTTLTHFTALYGVLGEEATLKYVDQTLAGGVHLTKGNAHLMKLVASGELHFGWTDTDDFNVAREEGHPVAVVYPDQEGEDALGTMIIPNTVAVLKAAPHPEAARKLVDYILSPQVEAEMARSRSAQIPVRADVPRPDYVRSAAELKVMEVNYVQVGRQIQQRHGELVEKYLD